MKSRMFAIKAIIKIIYAAIKANIKSVLVVFTLDIISPGNFKRASTTVGINAPMPTKIAKNVPEIMRDKLTEALPEILNILITSIDLNWFNIIIIACLVSFVNINLSKNNNFLSLF